MSPEIGAVESAVTSAEPQAILYPGSGIGEPMGQVASAGTTATDGSDKVTTITAGTGNVSWA